MAEQIIFNARSNRTVVSQPASQFSRSSFLAPDLPDSSSFFGTTSGERSLSGEREFTTPTRANHWLNTEDVQSNGFEQPSTAQQLSTQQLLDRLSHRASDPPAKPDPHSTSRSSTFNQRASSHLPSYCPPQSRPPQHPSSPHQHTANPAVRHCGENSRAPVRSAVPSAGRLHQRKPGRSPPSTPENTPLLDPQQARTGLPHFELQGQPGPNGTAPMSQHHVDSPVHHTPPPQQQQQPVSWMNRNCNLSSRQQARRKSPNQDEPADASLSNEPRGEHAAGMYNTHDGAIEAAILRAASAEAAVVEQAEARAAAFTAPIQHRQKGAQPTVPVATTPTTGRIVQRKPGKSPPNTPPLKSQHTGSAPPTHFELQAEQDGQHVQQTQGNRRRVWGTRTQHNHPETTAEQPKGSRPTAVPRVTIQINPGGYDGTRHASFDTPADGVRNHASVDASNCVTAAAENQQQWLTTDLAYSGWVQREYEPPLESPQTMLGLQTSSQGWSTRLLPDVRHQEQMDSRRNVSGRHNLPRSVQSLDAEMFKGMSRVTRR